MPAPTESSQLLLLFVRSFLLLQITLVTLILGYFLYGWETALSTAIYVYIGTWIYQTLLMPRWVVGGITLAFIISISYYTIKSYGYPLGIYISFGIITLISIIVTATVLITYHIEAFKADKKERQ